MKTFDQWIENPAQNIVSGQLHDQEKETDRESVDSQQHRGNDPRNDVGIFIHFVWFLIPVHFLPRNVSLACSYSDFGPAFTMASGMLVYFLKFLMKLWASSLAAAS